MVEPQSSKLATRVRFPSPAPRLTRGFASRKIVRLRRVPRDVPRKPVSCPSWRVDLAPARHARRARSARSVADPCGCALRRGRSAHEEAPRPRGDRPARPERPAAGGGDPRPVPAGDRGEAEPAYHRDRRPAPAAIPRAVRRRCEHAGPVPHSRPQPHLAVPRTPEVGPARRRDARLVLRGAAPVPEPLHGASCDLEHRVDGPHECNDRCRPHQCRPLAATTIRHIHFILSGAYKRAVRWRWVSVNPTALAEPPPAPKPNPQPPTAEQAARIVTESWRDPDWGTLVWTAMTTGVRRGELCAIRLSSVDLAEGRETVWLRKAIRRNPGAGWVEGDLKTHQQRRIALDAETIAVLREHVARCRAGRPRSGSSSRPRRSCSLARPTARRSSPRTA